MTWTAEIFGFGSHFSGRRSRTSDVDVLVVHQDGSPESIDFALDCKAKLRTAVPSAHITVLSQGEERELAFKEKCQAMQLGSISSGNVSAGVGMLEKKIRSFGVFDKPSISP